LYFEAKPNAMAETFESKVNAKDSWEPLDDCHVACKVILDKLGHEILIKDCVSPFAGPARYAGPAHLEVPELGDYAKIIHEPMDFGIIKERLDSGQYAVYGELLAGAFHRDVTLIFDIAKLYYNEGHEIHRDATKFQSIFDKLWSDINSSVRAKNRGLIERQTKLENILGDDAVQGLLQSYLTKLKEQVGFFFDSASGERREIVGESIR